MNISYLDLLGIVLWTTLFTSIWIKRKTKQKENDARWNKMMTEAEQRTD